MMRLQKFLAQAGVASRRKAEQLIEAGLIKVNGEKITKLGTVIDENSDQVDFKGQNIKIKSQKIYLALNKPAGFISSASDRQGKTIMGLVNSRERIYPVGRLDKDSSGLIILTSDGDFANRLTHPRYEKEKEYEVHLDKPLAKEDAAAINNGMNLDGKKLQPVRLVSNQKRIIRLVLKEGVNRQIRRMLGQLGYDVLTLKRVRIGRLTLSGLKEGEWKIIDPKQI